VLIVTTKINYENWPILRTDLQDMKYRNYCFKCSIGRHSQHSTFTGKGNQHGIWVAAWEHDQDVCECERCYDPRLYGGYRPLGGKQYE